MVWGMDIPSTFGDFWPRGGYEGTDGNWAKRLDEYFYKGGISEEKKAAMLPGLREASLSYSIYVSKKLKSEPGSREDGRGLPFLPVEPHEVPEFYKAEKSSTSLGSLIALNYGILAVDGKLKAIIERLEPGVHQFFPIEIRMPKGKIYSEPYYIVLIGQYIDSFSPTKSKEGCWREPVTGKFTHDEWKKGFSGIALAKDAFGQAHLWREGSFIDYLTCLSDELKAAIDQEGLRLPKHYKMMEV